MNLHQCCEHTANLLHIPIRLYSASGLLKRQYPGHGEHRDILACDHAFRNRLLKRVQKDYPLLYGEQNVTFYGAIKLSDDQCVVLGPLCLEGAGPHIPLRDFCEGVLLLDDFYWGHDLTCETLLDLNFKSGDGRESLQPASLLVTRCREVIQRRLYEKITVKELAAELRVSPAHLSRVFHEEQQVTLTDYITREKIRRACELLRSTNDSYEAIAYELGFSSQSYFGAVFKKLEGITPRDFRRQNRLEEELLGRKKPDN